MANTKSAKKAIKKITRNTIANKVYKTRMKTTEKKFLSAITETVEKSQLELLLNAYYKRLDLAVKKNIIHKNKAARKKSQMAKKLATVGQ
jgi:small subunit ribosomal protein S20